MVSEASDNARLIGRVFGVGPEAEGKGLKFGDICEVSRWSCAFDQGWWLNPQKLLDGAFHGPYALEDPEGSGIVLEASPYERWVFVRPEQVICRICSVGEVPGHYPTADRVFLEHRPLPETTASGIVLGHLHRRRRNPLARVLAIGPQVDGEDMAPGQWVLLDERTPATELKHEDGRTFTMAHAGDVLMNFGENPPNEAEVKRMERR